MKIGFDARMLKGGFDKMKNLNKVRGRDAYRF